MKGTLNGNTLRFERTLAHPIDKVWHVLTDEAETAYWFPGRIVGARTPGARIRFVFEAKPAGVMDDALAALIESKQAEFATAPPDVFEGTIEIFDPPRVFALTWAGDKLRFELSEVGDATRLVFTHQFLEADPGNVAAGWHVSLDWLAKRAGDGSPPTTRREFDAIEADYKRGF